MILLWNTHNRVLVRQKADFQGCWGLGEGEWTSEVLAQLPDFYFIVMREF